MTTETDVLELAGRLEKPVYSDELMQRWDRWRKMHKEGFGGSLTRDEFESIIDHIDEERTEAAQALRALHEANANLAAEAEGLRELVRTAHDSLLGVLCDPDSRCCIEGTDADREVVDDALADLRRALT